MRRTAFTIVELLVVIAIIGVLVAITIPALQSARESARRIVCTNNLHQIGLAVTQYTEQLGSMPSSSSSKIDQGVWISNPTKSNLHSWASLILPYMEQSGLSRQINYNVSCLAPANLAPASQLIEIYRCPSYGGNKYSMDPLYTSISPTFAIRNYVAMGSTTVERIWAQPNEPPPDGCMYAQSNTKLAEIRDGLSNTLVIAETREENAAVWIDGSAASVTSRRFDLNTTPSYAGPEASLNYTPYYSTFGTIGIDCAYGPSSEHPGGAMHLFADGSVRFIGNSVLVSVYDAITSRNGGETVDGASIR
jgi:prepilin-type N-terminal cleavage/methylation domain-containing protein/prepilin-type processing-associated H-X9-DG protein